MFPLHSLAFTGIQCTDAHLANKWGCVSCVDEATEWNAVNLLVDDNVVQQVAQQKELQTVMAVVWGGGGVQGIEPSTSAIGGGGEKAMVDTDTQSHKHKQTSTGTRKKSRLGASEMEIPPKKSCSG